MKEYVEGGSVRETNNEELPDSQIDNEPSILITRSGQDPYLSFAENFLSDAELEGIMSFLQSSDYQFKDVASKRKTLYFGEYGYRYIGMETSSMMQHLFLKLSQLSSCMLERNSQMKLSTLVS